MGLRLMVFLPLVQFMGLISLFDLAQSGSIAMLPAIFSLGGIKVCLPKFPPRFFKLFVNSVRLYNWRFVFSIL